MDRAVPLGRFLQCSSGLVSRTKTSAERKPPWMKAAIRTELRCREPLSQVQEHRLNMMFLEAFCTNIFECSKAREAPTRRAQR